MKSHIRRSKASGSDKARVELAIRRGWKPGYPVSDFIRRARRNRHQEQIIQ